MGTKLFIVERGKDGLLRPIDWPGDTEAWQTQDVPIGAMWRCECHDEQGWMIRIPGSADFGEHGRFANLWCTLAASDGGTRWNVSGEAPNLTVEPSIHAQPNEGPPGEWHGWITNGEIVDA